MTPQQQVAQLLDEAKTLSTPLGDGALNWQCWDGPKKSRPLLLLHGGFGSWTHWLANISTLRRSRTLWAVDIPGLGASAPMPEPATLEHFASLLLDSLNTLHGLEIEFDIAGFSFGALVGAHLAALAQTRCHHFIACGAAGFDKLHVQVDLLRPPTVGTPAQEADRIHRHNLATLMFAKNDCADDLAIHLHGDNLSRARFNSRRLARGDGFAVALPNIKAKLCGIWGSEDATAGGKSGIAKREALFRSYQPDCAFHLMEGVGHWAMYEAAQDFNRIVLAELDQ
ncbi:MAG: alpha/beta fold hydrolase [Halioglobus sp.]